MSIFYVRPSGGTYGSENGTSYANAWDGFSNITWGAGGVLAGDELYICGAHAEYLTVGQSGSSGSNVVIRGDYPGDPGSIGTTGIDTCVLLNAKSYITVRNLTCTSADTYGGIFLLNSDNNIVKNCTISACVNASTYGGVHIQDGSSNVITMNTVTTSSVGIGASLFAGTCNANTISGNIITNCDDYGISCGTNGGTNNICEYNVVSGCKGTDDRVGIGTYNPGTGNIFRYNVSHSNGDATHRYCGFWVDGSGAEEATSFYYNIAYGNNNGGYAGTGNVVHKFYNNVGYYNYGDYDNGEMCLFFAGENAQGYLIRNNIFVTASGKMLLNVALNQATGHTINYNCWYGGSATPFTWNGTARNWADYKTASSQDANSINVDPQFLNSSGRDFRLNSGSPCINTGTSVSLTRDYSGIPVPYPGGTIDMGAFEYFRLRNTIGKNDIVSIPNM